MLTVIPLSRPSFVAESAALLTCVCVTWWQVGTILSYLLGHGKAQRCHSLL